MSKKEPSISTGFWELVYQERGVVILCAYKSSAACIKKFYAYLLEENVVELEDFDSICFTIKERMPDWAELDEMIRCEDTKLYFGRE